MESTKESKKEATATKETPEKKEEKDKPVEKKELTPEELEQLLINDVKGFITILEKSVASSEPRMCGRVIRGISSVRKRMTPKLLRTIL